MNYYKVTFKEIPTIVFAHKYKTERYEMRFRKTPADRIELSFIESGTLFFSNQKTMPEGTLNMAVFDTDVQGTSHGVPHRHSTIGIKGGIWEKTDPEKLFRELNSEQKDSEVFFAAGDTAFLSKTSLRAKEIIEDIIAMQLAGRSKNALLSKLFSLFSLLSQDTLSSLPRENDKHSYSDYMYCDKARKYISEHIHEKIRVEDIADNLSLSREHLSRIFRSVTSDTLVGYINRTKIEAICEIIDTVGGTAEELAELFSLSDEKYLCRLFKKYKGVNISEYRKNSSGAFCVL